MNYKTGYRWNANKWFFKSIQIMEDPDFAGEYLLPARTTFEVPPAHTDTQWARWNEVVGVWQLVDCSMEERLKEGLITQDEYDEYLKKLEGNFVIDLKDKLNSNVNNIALDKDLKKESAERIAEDEAIKISLDEEVKVRSEADKVLESVDEELKEDIKELKGTDESIKTSVENLKEADKGLKAVDEALKATDKELKIADEALKLATENLAKKDEEILANIESLGQVDAKLSKWLADEVTERANQDKAICNYIEAIKNAIMGDMKKMEKRLYVASADNTTRVLTVKEPVNIEPNKEYTILADGRIDLDTQVNLIVNGQSYKIVMGTYHIDGVSDKCCFDVTFIDNIAYVTRLHNCSRSYSSYYGSFITVN